MSRSAMTKQSPRTLARLLRFARNGRAFLLPLFVSPNNLHDSAGLCRASTRDAAPPGAGGAGRARLFLSCAASSVANSVDRRSRRRSRARSARPGPRSDQGRRATTRSSPISGRATAILCCCARPSNWLHGAVVGWAGADPVAWRLGIHRYYRHRRRDEPPAVERRGAAAQTAGRRCRRRAGGGAEHRSCRRADQGPTSLAMALLLVPLLAAAAGRIARRRQPAWSTATSWPKSSATFGRGVLSAEQADAARTDRPDARR